MLGSHDILKMHDQNTQCENHAAIPRTRFPRVYATGHACKNMQDPLNSQGNKAEIINIREYSEKISRKDIGLC